MDSKRVSATGPWSFVIGTEFELIDNGDSVHDGWTSRGVHQLEVPNTSWPAET
jgi:hypothetical protein